MILSESQIFNLDLVENAEQQRDRHIIEKYYKSTRQLFIGQFVVNKYIIIAPSRRFFVINGTMNLQKKDLALQMLGQDLDDENLMKFIRDEFDRMSDIRRTDQEIDDMFVNHGED